MKCPSCGQEAACRRGEYHFTESGLDNVWLTDVEVCECACGEVLVEIPRPLDLQAQIGRSLVAKKTLLSGPEIRFLRKNMGLPAVRLAALMGVAKETVSLWENSKQPMDEGHDRLLRTIYILNKHLPGETAWELVEHDFPIIDPASTASEPLRIPLGSWTCQGDQGESLPLVA